jgi:hypothetical protein
MPIHDVQCSKCGTIIENYYASPWPTSISHDEDGGELLILWRSDSSHCAAVHPQDRTVVYRNPKTGQIAYPGKNDGSMNERYRKQGFERVEFEHAHDLERFEKETGTLNEGLWYNNGNGQG